MKPLKNKQAGNFVTFLIALIVLIILIIIVVGNSADLKYTEALALESGKWQEYAAHNCRLTERASGAEMKLGKHTYTFIGGAWDCNNGLRYWVSDEVAKCARQAQACLNLVPDAIPVTPDNTVK